MASWTPYYIGQPPTGTQNGVPFYYPPNPAAPPPVAPGVPTLSAPGPYVNPPVAYDPAAVTPWGSYPWAPTPSPQQQQQNERNVAGFNPNIYDNYPQHARSSSGPNYNHPSYDTSKDWPAGTTMRDGHLMYKAQDKIVGPTNAQYKNTSKALAGPPGNIPNPAGQTYGPSFDRWHYPEDHATLQPLAQQASREAGT